MVQLAFGWGEKQKWKVNPVTSAPMINLNSWSDWFRHYFNTFMTGCYWENYNAISVVYKNVDKCLLSMFHYPWLFSGSLLELGYVILIPFSNNKNLSKPSRINLDQWSFSYISHMWPIGRATYCSSLLSSIIFVQTVCSNTPILLASNIAWLGQ